MFLVNRVKRFLGGVMRFRVGARQWVRTALLALVATAVTVFATPAPSMADGDLYFVGCEGSYT